MSKVIPDVVETIRPCTICCEDREIPVVLPTASCLHTSTVCGLCLRKLTNSILQGGSRNRCPTEGCHSQFSDDDFIKWADPKVWQTKIMADLEKYEHFVQCLSGECSFGQFHAEGDKEPIVKCWNCGSKQCFIHRVPWHENFTCAQWKRNEDRKSNHMSRHIMLKETKKCPSCKAPIHKSEGCDWMTCRCGHEFCYKCRAPYVRIRRGNHHHRRFCPYYTTKRVGSKDEPDWWEFWRVRWWRRSRWRDRE